MKTTSKALGRSGIVCLVAALGLLVAIAGVSVWQSARNADSLALTQATRLQRNIVSAIMLAVEDAETAQRGFLITVDPDYLQPLADVFL